MTTEPEDPHQDPWLKGTAESLKEAWMVVADFDKCSNDFLSKTMFTEKEIKNN